MTKMVVKSKFKLCALVGIAICVLSLLVHLLLADYSTEFIPYKLRGDDFYPTEKVSSIVTIFITTVSFMDL